MKMSMILGDDFTSQTTTNKERMKITKFVKEPMEQLMLDNENESGKNK